MTAIRNLMTPGPTTVRRDAAITEAARLMRQEDVGILPVVDDGAVVGVVTDRDLVIRALADGRADAVVSDVMSANPVTLSATDDEHRAEELMTQYEVRRLPVCEGDRIVGMVSVGDLAVRASEEVAGHVLDETGPEE